MTLALKRIQEPDRKTRPAQAASTRGKSATLRIVAPAQLHLYENVWEKLCATAIVPNPFFEPWMLLPALEHLVDKEDLHFLLIFGPAGKDGIEPLWGLFPLELQQKCLQLPVRTLAFWHHRYCALATPLIAAAHVWETLEAFWTWFQQNPFGCRILDTNYLLAEGSFHAVWADFAIGRTSFLLNEFPRALLKPSGTAEAYLSNAVSKKHHDEFLRQERRLAALGELRYLRVISPSSVDGWVDDFLRLEACGWKGNVGGAFAKDPQNAAYLREITRDGFLQNRLVLWSLVLDGKVIAMKHILRANEGAFAFKIAYDEDYAKYSPGMLLELEYIRKVFHDPQVRWVDSCAAPRHTLVSRIWSERRMIRRTLFSDNSRLGDLVISSLPLLRWMKRLVRPEAGESYLQISTKEKKQGC